MSEPLRVVFYSTWFIVPATYVLVSIYTLNWDIEGITNKSIYLIPSLNSYNSQILTVTLQDGEMGCRGSWLLSSPPSKQFSFSSQVSSFILKQTISLSTKLSFFQSERLKVPLSGIRSDPCLLDKHFSLHHSTSTKMRLNSNLPGYEGSCKRIFIVLNEFIPAHLNQVHCRCSGRNQAVI